jgi:hypothetical protein
MAVLLVMSFCEQDLTSGGISEEGYPEAVQGDPIGLDFGGPGPLSASEVGHSFRYCAPAFLKYDDINSPHLSVPHRRHLNIFDDTFFLVGSIIEPMSQNHS